MYLSTLQLSKTTAWDVKTELLGSASDTQTVEKLHMEVATLIYCASKDEFDESEWKPVLYEYR